MNRARQGESGVVMMEFLIALFPVMLAFLGMVQFSFASVARLVVRHAATVGARAAVVVVEESADVPGAPADAYDGLPAGELEIEDDGEEREDPAASNDSGLRNTAAATPADAPASSQVQDLLGVLDRGKSRVQQIRTAAYMPLLAVSPDAVEDGLGFLVGAAQGELFGEETVEDAIGGTGISRLVGAFLYNLGAVAVTFPKAPGSEEYVDGPLAHDAEVTVRVTYLFRCRVPIASLLLCDSGWALLAGTPFVDPALYWEMRNLGAERPEREADLPDWLARLKSTQSRFERRQRRLDAFDEQQPELEQVESPTVQQLLLLRPGARYMVMQAESTLPLQGARYYPRGSGG